MGDPAKTIGLISTLNTEMLIAMIILKIIAEVFLGILSVWAGMAFWGVIRKNKYLRAILADQEFLNEWIGNPDKRENISKMASEIKQVVDKEYAYAVNLSIITHGTKAADRNVRILALFAVIAVSVASFFLGKWYILINVLLFSISWVLSLSEEATKSALGTILELGVTLFKWNQEDKEGCREFIKEAKSLHKLYNAVTRIH